MIEKFPRHLEFLRQLGRERFDPESLGRVMAAKEEIDAEFLRRDRRPVRRFARDVGVDSLPRGGVDFSAGAAVTIPMRFVSIGPAPMQRTGPPNDSSSFAISSSRRSVASA